VTPLAQELLIKVVAPVAVTGFLTFVGWLSRQTWKLFKAVVWLADNVQALADQTRLASEAQGIPHRRIDVITDALEDSRYPHRGLVPQERQRRKDETLALEDRKGVEAVRALRARLRDAKPGPRA
jgi:hypothetical protein